MTNEVKNGCCVCIYNQNGCTLGGLKEPPVTWKLCVLRKELAQKLILEAKQARAAP